jgi:hypothetical protein
MEGLTAYHWIDALAIDNQVQIRVACGWYSRPETRPI